VGDTFYRAVPQEKAETVQQESFASDWPSDVVGSTVRSVRSIVEAITGQYKVLDARCRPLSVRGAVGWLGRSGEKIQ
jgi:hypothetical protein